MLELYYKIWVSNYLRIQKAQNSSKNYAIFLSLLVISSMNFLNYFTISALLLLIFKIEFNIFHLIKFDNNIIRALFVMFLFISPNYFLLVFNKKHDRLLLKYGNNNNDRLGFYSYLISSLIIIVIVLLTFIFPHFFGLKPSSKG